MVRKCCWCLKAGDDVCTSILLGQVIQGSLRCEYLGKVTLMTKVEFDSKLQRILNKAVLGPEINYFIRAGIIYLKQAKRML